MRNFVHLHSSSAYSAHFGVSWPEDLAAAAAVDGDALAITDRDGLYGAVKHVKACMAAGIDPIIGVDLAVLEEGPHGLYASGRVVVLAHGGAAVAPGTGYAALCRLISLAHAGSATVGVTLEQLAAGVLDPISGTPALTVLLGPMSPVGRAMGGNQQYLLPRRKFRAWHRAMPAGSFVVELVNHQSSQGTAMSMSYAVRLLKLRGLRQIGRAHV